MPGSKSRDATLMGTTLRGEENKNMRCNTDGQVQAIRDATLMGNSTPGKGKQIEVWDATLIGNSTLKEENK